jgi:hypothetical protein
MKKPSKVLIGLALAAVGAFGAGSAMAWVHHPRVVVGFNIGPYWGAPWWGPYPYYYPAPVYYPPVVVQQQPTTYVERNDQPLQSGYWYYCEPSRAYYPYVKECASAWKAVPPSPPAQ